MSDDRPKAGATPSADPLALIRAAAASAHEHRRDLARAERPCNLVKMWTEATPIAGTCAELYLHRLGATLTPARALRFRSGDNPALLAAIKEVDGTLVGIQATRLTETGQAVELASRRITGSPGTGTVQLFRINRTLGIASSVEDAIAATHLTCIPCWAAVRPSQLVNIEIPSGVRELHLFANRGYYFANPDGLHALASRQTARSVIVVIEHCDDRFERWKDVIDPARAGGDRHDHD